MSLIFHIPKVVYVDNHGVGERMVSYAFWSDHVAFQTPLDLRTHDELMTLRLEGRYWLWGVVLSEVTRLHPPIFALKNTCT